MLGTLWGINTIYIIIGVVLLLLLIIVFNHGNKRKRAEQEAAAAPLAFIPKEELPLAPQLTPQPEPQPEQKQVSGLNAQTVAAIMAAVSAASAIPVQQLRFTAIRRVSGIQSQWAGSGTSEIIATRQTYL